MHVKKRRIAEDFEDCSMKIPHLLAMQRNEEVCCRRQGKSDLSTLLSNLFQDCAKGGLGKATVKPGLLIVFVSRTQSLGAIIEGITKWFVDAFEGVAPSHENLQSDELQEHYWRGFSVTLSKAVEHERGWVATKMGLFDIFEEGDGR